jgi:hypothetical protein
VAFAIETGPLVPAISVVLAYAENEPAATSFARGGRSGALSPLAAEIFPKEMSTPATPAVERAFAKFASHRENLAGDPSRMVRQAQRELSRPRSLILFDWELNICDGVSEAESDGFFSESNFPPWDYWLAILRARSDRMLLLSFVPSFAGAAADRGISVTAYDDLAWCKPRSLAVIPLPWGEAWSEGAV